MALWSTSIGASLLNLTVGLILVFCLVVPKALIASGVILLNS